MVLSLPLRRIDGVGVGYIEAATSASMMGGYVDGFTEVFLLEFQVMVTWPDDAGGKRISTCAVALYSARLDFVLS
jgi:hypothetical protein